MSENLCVVCGRPTPDGYVCQSEMVKAAAQLAEIADLAVPARDVAQGQTSHGVGGSSGKPGSRLPFNLGATARVNGVENNMATWARHIAETRGVALP